jgi:cell division protein FtsB
MKKQGRIWYLVAWLIVIVVGLAYIERRDLLGRYNQYTQSVESVRAARERVEALETAVNQSRQMVRNLDKDPLEVEAAIRRIKQMVRPGETVFSLEEAGQDIKPSKP